MEFTGQYPIGAIKLNDPASPISAGMETYSPFIPLDYDNSSLPVTVIEITLKNAGETDARIELEAYLENAAIRYLDGRVTRCSRTPTEIGAIGNGRSWHKARAASFKPICQKSPATLVERQRAAFPPEQSPAKDSQPSAAPTTV